MRIPIDFMPRDYQLPLLEALDAGCKRACVIWSRRSGKDLCALNWVVKEMVKRSIIVYYLFPTGLLAKKVIWNGKRRDGKDFMDVFPKELVAKSNENEMKVILKNKSLFQLVGSDKVDVVGTNPSICVFSEYSLQDPQAWNFIRPILVENGGTAIFIYTPRGQNHGYELYNMAVDNDKWFTQLLTVEDILDHSGNRVITDEAIDEERKAGMPENLIRQEFYSDWSMGLEGSYYSNLIMDARRNKRIGKVPHDPHSQVSTFWDLGISDATTIWFVQFIGKEIRVINYYENSGEGIAHYIKHLSNLPYNYENHYGPHDIEKRELGTGVSIKETAKSLGLNFITVPRSRNINNGIEAVRGLLPTCWFDQSHCERGLKALDYYRKAWNPSLAVYTDRPQHDWSSHGADGFRTLAESKPFRRQTSMSVKKVRSLHEEFRCAC